MKALSLTPVLWTENLQATLDFYTTNLNFTCIERKEEWGWAYMSNGSVEVMLSVPNEHMKFERSLFTGSFYFKIENADELYESLKEKVKIVYPIENFEWGMREFAIFDNNGYILQFGESIENK